MPSASSWCAWAGPTAMPSAAPTMQFYAQYQAEKLDVEAYIRFATSAWRERPAGRAGRGQPALHRRDDPPGSARFGACAAAPPRRRRRPGGHRHRHQRVHHPADRHALRRRRTDRHRTAARCRRPRHRRRPRRAGLPRRQGHARAAMAGAARAWPATTSIASPSTAIPPTTCLCSSASATRWRPTPRRRWNASPPSAAGPSSGSLHDQEIHRPPARQERRRAWARGAAGQARRGRRGRARHRPGPARRLRGARGAHAQGGRARGLHRRRRGARPAGRAAAEGLRRRHRRHARAGEGAVPPRLHHRPALPHRARDLRPRPRPRGDRGLDLPRPARLGRGRPGERQREDLEAGAERQGARGRCQRARAARQRLGPADRGCGAARLHRQRAVLRPDRRRSSSTTTTASRTPRSACCA